jgi:UDP-glucose 4-epimerase
MGVSVIGLRYFNVFGKRQSKEYAGVIKLFLEQIRNELPPKINGNGTQSRDFVHVDDVVNANIMSMNSDVTHEFFNVGTNSSITVRDLAKTVIEASGLDIEPIFGPGLEGDVDKTIANIDLIKQKIGWKPSVMLVDWLKEIISSKKIDEV